MAKKSAFAESLMKNSMKINELHAALNRTFKNRDNDRQAWIDAARAFRGTYDELAFPGGLEANMNLLRKHDSATIQKAIEYLEVDPYYFRSGYNKERIIHLLKNAPLTEDQRKQLRSVLITELKKNKRARHFRDYCRLARVVADEEFCTLIRAIISQSADLQMRKSAQYMLDAINKN